MNAGARVAPITNKLRNHDWARREKTQPDEGTDRFRDDSPPHTSTSGKTTLRADC